MIISCLRFIFYVSFLIANLLIKTNFEMLQLDLDVFQLEIVC